MGLNLDLGLMWLEQILALSGLIALNLKKELLQSIDLLGQKELRRFLRGEQEGLSKI